MELKSNIYHYLQTMQQQPMMAKSQAHVQGIWVYLSVSEDRPNSQAECTWNRGKFTSGKGRNYVLTKPRLQVS